MPPKKSASRYIAHWLHSHWSTNVSRANAPLFYTTVGSKSIPTNGSHHFLPGPSRRQAPVIKCNAFLCFQSYIVRDISLTEIYRWLVTFIEILSAILKSTSGGVKRKIIAFWTTRFPAFMSKNLRVNIWRDKFTSDRLRVNLPLWNVTRK